MSSRALRVAFWMLRCGVGRKYGIIDIKRNVVAIAVYSSDKIPSNVSVAVKSVVEIY